MGGPSDHHIPTGLILQVREDVLTAGNLDAKRMIFPGGLGLNPLEFMDELNELFIIRGYHVIIFYLPHLEFCFTIWVTLFLAI